MDFYALLDQIVEVLRARGRVSNRALKHQFDLDDELLDTLTEEMVYAYRGVISQDGPGLVWSSDADVTAAQLLVTEHALDGVESAETSLVQPVFPPPLSDGQAAERRQLTAMFCDLVDSTPLASRLDPEELRDVVHAYQETCTKVIVRYGGHIAYYLGDGLLVYFGYPQAHEDDATRAVRAGLGIVEAIGQLNKILTEERGVSLAVRVGCHTGPVVIDDIGGGGRHQRQAFGETLNIAARLQGIAAPNSLVIGALTFQLLGGVFVCESLGTPALRGVARPPEAYLVLSESVARTRLEAIGSSALTPLVGREPEMTLMRALWQRVEDGTGQAVLLCGEAGIGKSRLVRELTEYAAESEWWLTPCQCSPYYQHTALYPMIDLLERVVLRFDDEDSTVRKLHKLEGFLVERGLPLAESVPLFASLLSIPMDDDPSPSMSGEQLRQQTMQILLTVLLRIAAEQPVLFVVEDVHWADPTMLEWLGLVIEQLDTARILLLVTYRPEFTPSWATHSHVTPLTLGRLSPEQVVALISQVAHGKSLPAEVLAQVVDKTDGVPLFVEELTKMLLESRLLEERDDRYQLSGPLPPLAIPNTLHDSLMARLDRLAGAKSLAQLCSSLGREFNYALLQSVSPWDEVALRQGLDQLAAAEFIYPQGQPPEATYRFKHALIQDAAYQSLLKSTRRQYNLRIGQALESEFPETVAEHPELLAHHYTEAGVSARAVPYWQAAGQLALKRSAHAEGAEHVRRGLEVLSQLPDTDDRSQQELHLQIILGAALGATQGQQTTGQVYARACELARRVGTPPELFPALWGFWYAHIARGEVPRARTLAEEFLELAGQQQNPLVLCAGHRMLANTAFWQGQLADAHTHSQQGLAFYDREQQGANMVAYGQDSGIACGWIDALTLWVLGYPDRALEGMADTLSRARALAHPFSVAQVLIFSANLHQLRREPQAARACAEEGSALCSEHGFDVYGSWFLLPRGWAEVQQHRVGEGVADIQSALAARRALGPTAAMPWFLAVLADAYGTVSRFDEGLRTLDDALGWVQNNDEHLYEAEVYRLKGELLLGQDPTNAAIAEECFQQALAVARCQCAKSWELRAAMSLSRLWRQQGRSGEARALLAPTYEWFDEGFATLDLQDAKLLLETI